MLTRRERPSDISAISAVHAAAFADRTDGRTVHEQSEVRLVNELRAGPDWLERLSLVAVLDGEVVGHVCCSRGRLDEVVPALGLGPLGVLPSLQRRGVGTALMQAVLGAATALDEPLVCLLGYPGYYRRFGFVTAAELGVLAPDESWGESFMARRLLESGSAMSGRFSYPEAFDRV
jgi:putative acetyltransferase